VNTDVATVRRIPYIGPDLLPIAQVVAVLWRLLLAVPRCDIVHILAASYWAFYLPATLAFLVGKIAGRRVVLCYYGSQASEFLQRRQHLVWPMLRRMDALAVSSDYLREIFQRYGLETVLVPNLLWLEEWPFLDRDPWPPLVLWLDSLGRLANPAMALRALRLLRQTVPDARLLMVGTGSLAPKVGRQARELGVAEAVAYRSWLDPKQRQRVVQTTSVLWHSATHDNLPQILLEAAASGAAIVSTRVGAVPELLHDGVDALLVEPNDDERMAAATAQVLRRPVLAVGLTRNARLAVQRYTWSTVRKTVAEAYGLLPKEPSRSSSSTATGWESDDVLAHTEFLWSQADPVDSEQDAEASKES
jgi:glycosyltransferase involved in cell wall biosynthesis